MATVVNSFSITGIDAYVVKIEIDILYGKPYVSIVGMGDTAIKESKERLEAAIINSKFEFPKMKIVINLSPSDVRKSGSHFDSGMAVALLLQSHQIKSEEIDKFAFIGELSLNGDLRPCVGVLPMKNHKIDNPYIVDFQDVQGQDSAIEFVAVAAAGGHNLLMSGAPGCGKSMIAKRIPTILPPMSEEEALEVTKIYSVAGLLKNRGTLITERPFRSPHHNASMNSLVGGGIFAMPGEISLAHNGILFLDEIAEFNKKTLDALRQPMEDGKISIARVRHTHVFPASFMLVSAMNPCPCGYYGESRCHCTDYEILKYREKLSGPIMDRIDIQKYFRTVNIMDLANNVKGPSSKDLAQKVEVAREIQRKRYEGIIGVSCNAQMTPELIRQHCKLDEESIKMLRLAFDKFRYSARTYHKFLRVARTFADMECEKNINKSHVIKALMCREIEKEQATMVVV